MSEVILLGPQRRRPTSPAILRALAADAAAITAGWQESENDPLPRGLNGASVNLGIYARAERVFDQDRELFQAHRERQLELKQLQRLYRVRLDHAIAAYRELVEMPNGGALVAAERLAALQALRDLDRHHLERVRAVHAVFDRTWQPASRPAVARQREALAEVLADLEVVIIAGGHIAVLLNRMRLFDLAPLVADKTIIAWSAGAMVVAPTIVLFHDSPPWGAGNAEVLDSGLGLCDGILPLPDAPRRLLLHDPVRVAQLASRFAPLECVGMDGSAQLRHAGTDWQVRRARLLCEHGGVEVRGRSTWEALAR